MALERFGGPEVLEAMELPDPVPGPGEVLVQVVAAGVNPVDWKIREGLLQDAFPHRFPLVPGWEVAGKVEQLGPGVSRLRRGERVWAYARMPVIQWGAYAELIVLPETSVAPMPGKLLFEEAAAVPLAGLTAWQSLMLAGDVGPGSTVLVLGAAGGVGHLAVQLARQAGARVVGTAGPRNREFVLGLGAEDVVDYTRDDVVSTVRRWHPQGVDVVLDTVGGEAQAVGLDALKTGGRLVSLDKVFVEPSVEQLRSLAALVERGRLRPHVSTIYPLEQAAQAQRESQAGHVRGKLVLAL